MEPFPSIEESQIQDETNTKQLLLFVTQLDPPNGGHKNHDWKRSRIYKTPLKRVTTGRKNGEVGPFVDAPIGEHLRKSSHDSRVIQLPNGRFIVARFSDAQCVGATFMMVSRPPTSILEAKTPVVFGAVGCDRFCWEPCIDFKPEYTHKSIRYLNFNNKLPTNINKYIG